MTWNSGPAIAAGEDPTNYLLWLVLDYGEATFEHGRAQAAYEVARRRDARADASVVTRAGQRALASYEAVSSALRGVALSARET